MEKAEIKITISELMNGQLSLDCTVHCGSSEMLNELAHATAKELPPFVLKGITNSLLKRKENHAKH